MNLHDPFVLASLGILDILMLIYSISIYVDDGLYEFFLDLHTSLFLYIPSGSNMKPWTQGPFGS